MQKWIFVAASTYILMGCSLMQRSHESGYSNEYSSQPSSATQYYSNKRSQDVNLAKQELAIPLSRPLTETEQLRLSYKLRLNKLEKSLSTSEEKKQYYQLKPYFKNDIERIRFLKQPNTVARKRWVNNRGIKTNSSKFSDEVSRLIESNDISIGMNKKAVRESWGEPDYIEVAGNEIYGNERWNYVKVTSTPEGYKKENRIIYFEYSRVAGWDSKAQ
jgi:hypothetical protein